MPLFQPKFKQSKKGPEAEPPKPHSLPMAYGAQRRNPVKMAEGGVVPFKDDAQEHYASIADAILAKQRKATQATNIEETEVGTDPETFDSQNEEILDEPSRHGMKETAAQAEPKTMTDIIRKKMRALRGED